MEQSASGDVLPEGAEEEPLSKNARKRLIKAEYKEERKAKRKEEKKIRKEARKNDAAAEKEAAVDVSTSDALPKLPKPASAAARRELAWSTWQRIGCPQHVLAPMVNQSELAFRLLARQHGATLTYTPMLHSALFASSDVYRRDNFDEHASDRPLVVQFCGDDPATLLAAARHVEQRCDYVDLNCGCPQAIAKRGHYGAFLLDEPNLIVSIVRTLSEGLTVPVSVKVRVLPAGDGSVDTAATIALAQRLEAAGASLLTVHGRTRAQKCACQADWDTIRLIKEAVGIPVLANGGIERPEDLAACLAATKCDGVMTSEGALENPALFDGSPTSRANQAKVARQYVQHARAHPPRALAVLKAHFFKMLYLALPHHLEQRDGLGNAIDAETLYAVVETVCDKEEARAKECPGEMTARCDGPNAPWMTWYRRHRGALAAPADRYGASAPAEVEAAGGVELTAEGLVRKEEAATPSEKRE